MKRLANITIILLAIFACSFVYTQDVSDAEPLEGASVEEQALEDQALEDQVLEDQGLTQDQSYPLDLIYALDLINDIRLYPLNYAESLGYDRAQLMADLPWMKDVFEKGLPPCSFKVDLNTMAEEHNAQEESMVQDEIPTDSNSIVSTPQAALTGKMGGVVSFYNFMSAEFAWEIIIKNQFMKELQPDMADPGYILNPGFDSLGMAIRGGMHDVDGIMKNAYFATICFASSRLKSEVQVLNMINQVRYQPGTVEKYSGVSFFKLLGGSTSYLREWFGEYYPPLLDSSFLHDYAKASSNNGLTALNSIGESIEDSAPLPNVLEMGYEGVQTTESVFEFSMNLESSVPEQSIDLTSDQIALMVFSTLIQDEFAALPERKAIFSLEKSHGGLGISFAQQDDQEMLCSVVVAGASQVVDVGIDPGGDAQDDDAGQLPGPLTEMQAQTQAGIYGIVYFDKDENEIYSPGEGTVLASVVVYRQSDNVVVNRVYTDNAGHFSIYLEKGQEYRFEISGQIPDEMISDEISDQTPGKDATTTLHIQVDDVNLFLPVDLSQSQDLLLSE